MHPPFLCYPLSAHHLPLFFFFNDPATTEIYTLSLHDALPISQRVKLLEERLGTVLIVRGQPCTRSEEHTSELQSQFHLVCRLLLEKKKAQYLEHLDSDNGSR